MCAQHHTAYRKWSQDLNQASEIPETPKVKRPVGWKGSVLMGTASAMGTHTCHHPRALETLSSEKCFHWPGASSPAPSPLCEELAGFETVAYQQSSFPDSVKFQKQSFIIPTMPRPAPLPRPHCSLVLESSPETCRHLRLSLSPKNEADSSSPELPSL